MGTDDDSLIRVIVTRCEIDMVQIKDAFKAEYAETLGNFIKVSRWFIFIPPRDSAILIFAIFSQDDTSGDYRLILLTLIGEEALMKK